MAYSVIYRTGGTENFRWKKVLERYPDKWSAKVARDELRRAGYPALVRRTGLPLPRTYVAGEVM